MSKGFTLIEVIVSVALIFVIGLALNKIALSNIETLEKYKKYNISYASAVLHSSNEYKEINSYFNFGNKQHMPKIDVEVSKRTEFLESSSIPISDEFIINYTQNKVEIKLNDEKITFLSID